MSYPETAGYQKHSATSSMAADELTSQHSMEADIFTLLETYPSGFTADELQDALTDKHPGVQAGTIAARLRGLELKGRIKKTKETRLTKNRRQAQVWKHPSHVKADDLIAAQPIKTRDIDEPDNAALALVIAERDKYRKALESCRGRSYKTIIGIIATALSQPD